MVLVALLLVLPSVVMLACFTASPARTGTRARTEKIGIPDLVLCAIALWALFGGKEFGSATNTLIVETEDGETVTREVPKTEFVKSTALLPLALGPGVGEDESWIAYAVPEALVLDLMADDFFAPITRV